MGSVAVEAAPTAVVVSRRPRIGVASSALHVFEQHVRGSP